MQAKRVIVSVLAIGLMLALTAGLGWAQSQGPSAAVGTVFTYQGQLNDGSGPVDGSCDFQFSLWDSYGNPTGQVGVNQTVPGVTVSQGLFTVQLDFGAAAFQGDSRWLEVSVRCPAGSGEYQTLTPRQALTAAPYALYAPVAGSAPWSGLSGVPGDLADGDDDTLYSAGSGLILSSGEFRVDPALVQARVGQSCPEESAIRVIHEDGTVVCQSVAGGTGDVTGVYAGTGLSGGGDSGELTLSADTAYLQRRVLGTCGLGSSIRVINQNGTVMCETDDDTTYSPGTGLSLSGGQFSVNFAGSGTAGTASRSDHHHDSTYVNEDQANSVGTGMVQNSTLLLEDLNQNGCGTGQIIKWNGSTWACAADATGGTGYWSLTGNTGTTPGTNYLGTSDSAALVIKVNNTRALRIEPSSETPNLIGGWWENFVDAGVVGATIGGGGSGEYGENRVTDMFGTVGGGVFNQAGDNTTEDFYYPTVSGGYRNTATRSWSTVGGGGNNTASHTYSTVSGGDSNSASGYISTVGGGGNNIASGGVSTVSGGGNNTASYYYATVGGGRENLASNWDSTIAGGLGNTASGDKSAIAGGEGNTASGEYAAVGGGGVNDASGYGATVGGGGGNRATGDGSVVSGGIGMCVGTDYNNVASGSTSTIAGGACNVAENSDTTIAGGVYNIASGEYATVGGGTHNTASGTAAVVAGGGGSDVSGNYDNVASGNWSTIGGGGLNTASVQFTTIGGGNSNEVSGAYGTIAGGYNITVTAEYATVGGGEYNTATDESGTVAGGHNNQAGDNVGTAWDQPYATVGGGRDNVASGTSSVVGGGDTNAASGRWATVSGGAENTASGNATTVGGGTSNSASGGFGAVVGGGQWNSASDWFAAVVGGWNNTASGLAATIGGGEWNSASGEFAAVGGGGGNTANGSQATVGGGESHIASDNWGTVAGGYNNQAGDNAGTPEDRPYATVGGGRDNTAGGASSVVGGGDTNTASGWRSTVPGGVGNTAAGEHSFAAGRRAKALHNGAFVWADSTNSDFVSDAANEFLVRAYNGVKIVRGKSTFSPSQAALQVDQAAAAEAGWFYTAHAGNAYGVLKVAKDPAAPGTFIDGVDRTSGGAETRRFHIDKNGTYTAGSDFAEALPVAGNPASYEPGDVLVISLERPGGVEKCSQPYDSLVVGVYSTRPGFLGADKDGTTEVAAGEVPVAVLGIVPVKVTDENGPIRPGDLLTTSSTAGHAMRCAGLELCFGRTLGKALEGLPAGQHSGVIQMLVSLQ